MEEKRIFFEVLLTRGVIYNFVLRMISSPYLETCAKKQSKKFVVFQQDVCQQKDTSVLSCFPVHFLVIAANAYIGDISVLPEHFHFLHAPKQHHCWVGERKNAFRSLH